MSWIETHENVQFELLDPKPEMVNPLDLIVSLSQTCRFNGHTRGLYSVAQHSVQVSRLVERWARESKMSKKKTLLAMRWGLLHDAAEAYVGDLVRPLKWCTEMGALFKAIEIPIQRVVALRFGLPWPLPDYVIEAVSLADDCLLLTEARDLVHGYEHWDLYNPEAKPLEWKLDARSSTDAAYDFARRFNELGKLPLTEPDPLWTVDY